MFGRQKRRELRMVELIRDEMWAADRNAIAMLAEATAQIELRLSTDGEDRERARQSTETAIEQLRSSVIGHAIDVGRGLEQVAEMCALLAEQIEADRLERQALIEALTSLSLPRPSPSAGPSQVMGGIVFAASEISDGTGTGTDTPPTPAHPPRTEMAHPDESSPTTDRNATIMGAVEQRSRVNARRAATTNVRLQQSAQRTWRRLRDWLSDDRP
jgi:cobalamin biosynthesis Mg chelatase CobN